MNLKENMGTYRGGFARGKMVKKKIMQLYDKLKNNFKSIL